MKRELLFSVLLSPLALPLFFVGALAWLLVGEEEHAAPGWVAPPPPAKSVTKGEGSGERADSHAPKGERVGE